MNTPLGELKTRLFLNVSGQSWECSDGDIIGREGTIALEYFKGASVLSRKHVEIKIVEGEWAVRLCPTARNLTWINEEEMLPGQFYALGEQSVITVEEVQFTFLTHAGDDYREDTIVPEWSLPENRPVQTIAEEGLYASQGIGGAPAGLEYLPGCILVFDAFDRLLWSNADGEKFLGLNEPPSTLTAFFLSFHREDEITLRERMAGLREGDSETLNRLRVFDVSSGSVIGLVTVTLIKRGDQTIVFGEVAPDEEKSVLGLRLLSEAYLCPDFQDSDLRVCLQAVAENGLGVLGCDRVTIWLVKSENSVATRTVSVSRQGQSAEGLVDQIQPGFCPFYFDRLTVDTFAAFETEESPAMPILKDLGFADASTAAVLGVPLLQGGLKGIVSFEWNEWHGELPEGSRLSALLVASLCLSAAASTSHQAALKQLRLREEQMEKELADAEHYVRQVLPPPLSGEIDVSWMLKPSAQLGGDAFGYHWIDDERFAIYLLDVVGHGTGAALLSISAMNSVRAQILPDTDFGNPAAVLAGLNRAFQMETQNDMTFTVWYGIFHRSTRNLIYASAGHPPALLIDTNRASKCTELSTDGLIIGHIDDFEYENAQVIVPPDAKLYVLSDGAFEIERPNGEMWPYEQFVAAVRSTGSMQEGEVEYLYERTQQILEGNELQDDFTMVRARFS